MINDLDPGVRGWRIDKSISLADIVAIISSAVLVMLAYSALNTRMAVIEARQDAQQRQRAEDMQQLQQIRGDVEYIRRTIEQLAAREIAHRSGGAQ